MITTTKFNYQPHDSELERASNSYLMSLVAVIGGLPLPILNLMASVFFYLGNRKSTAFVKWHCTQALVSQLGLFFFNSAGFGGQFLFCSMMKQLLIIILLIF